MELEVVVGTYDSMIIGCSIDLLQKPEEQVLRRKYRERGHVGCVGCIASGGHYLASGGTDEIIKLYDMRKSVGVGTLLHHEGSITSLCFYKGNHLLSASEDGTICVWKCGGSWECLRTLTGHKWSVTCVAVHPSGQLALSVGKDRTVRTWNLSPGLAAFTLKLPKAASLVIWSPVGDLYVLAVGRTLMVYSVESGESTAVIEVGKTINSMLFIQDGVLAVGSDQPSISLYSITSGKCVASLEGHTNRVKGLALSPDNKLLFSASSDGTIRAWSLPKALENCKCVSCVDTCSRLTCITALWPMDVSGQGHTSEKGEKVVEKAVEESGGMLQVENVLDRTETKERRKRLLGVKDGKKKSVKKNKTKL